MGCRNEAAIALYETLGFRTDLSWSLGGKVPFGASWMQGRNHRDLTRSSSLLVAAATQTARTEIRKSNYYHRSVGSCHVSTMTCKWSC